MNTNTPINYKNLKRFYQNLKEKDLQELSERIDQAGIKYKAGDNIQINDDVISAINTIYTAGDNIQINDDEISAITGIRYDATKDSISEGIDSSNYGQLSLANGIRSHAEGLNTTSSGTCSHVEGANNTASGSCSHAEGSSTTASGTNSHAEGFSSQATSSNYSSNTLTADQNVSNGHMCHAEGNATIAQGYNSHAEGRKTFARGGVSHAEGDETIASGYASHAEGYYTKASGDCSHAEGVSIAIGNNSHAEGGPQNIYTESFGFNCDANSIEIEITSIHQPWYTYPAIGDIVKWNNLFRTVLGASSNIITINEAFSSSQISGQTLVKIGTDNNVSLGTASHTEGLATKALGSGSHAEGGYYQNGTVYKGGTASGQGSHAEGLATQATHDAEHAQGKYNKSNSVPIHQPIEYVDLGLPSGLLWAKWNLGATSETEYGYYYAWGETEPKSEYTWANYKWGDPDNGGITKYNSTDGKTELDPEDDAARVNLGGGWRMPTKDEVQELIDNCTYTWVTDYQGSGVNGGLFTSQNGNTLFVPAGDEGTSISTSTLLDISDNFGLYVEEYRHAVLDVFRYHGLMIKAVCSASDFNPDNIPLIPTGKYKNTIHSTGIGTSSSDRKNAFEIMDNGDVYIKGIGGYDGTNPDTAQSVQKYVNNLEIIINTFNERLLAIENNLEIG